MNDFVIAWEWTAATLVIYLMDEIENSLEFGLIIIVGSGEVVNVLYIFISIGLSNNAIV
jgi:hypothetical protein